AEFHGSRKYSVRCVAVPTVDEVEIVKSRHFLANSCQTTILKQAETFLVFGLEPLKPDPSVSPQVFQGFLHGCAALPLRHVEILSVIALMMAFALTCAAIVLSRPDNQTDDHDD